MNNMTRRRLRVSVASLTAAIPLSSFAQPETPGIHVLKDRNCGCCNAMPGCAFCGTMASL